MGVRARFLFQQLPFLQKGAGRGRGVVLDVSKMRRRSRRTSFSAFHLWLWSFSPPGFLRFCVDESVLSNDITP